VTKPQRGGPDYWIVKTDSAGNKLWDRRFGGNYEDICYALQKAADGGYILGGTSTSGISWDKTQDSWGSLDYWIVKVNAGGFKQWDKRFGGSGSDRMDSVQQTGDGDYLLGGYYNGTILSNNGDHTDTAWGGAWNEDFWMVKTDSSGSKLWDKRYGGTGDEAYIANVFKTNGGGFLVYSHTKKANANNTQSITIILAP
jgi:hypothetical protein